MMATQTSFSELLSTLTQALFSASESAKIITPLNPPKDGISLLDTKNELFLSYLQHLVFFVILKLRNQKQTSEDAENILNESVTKKLVELQVYLERGVRPLEGRLKYQIDKVVRAAEDVKRAEVTAMTQANKPPAEEEEERLEDSEDDSDTTSTNGVALKEPEINDLQYRPNPSAFVRSTAVQEIQPKGKVPDGTYRPPRIQATVMPSSRASEKTSKRQEKSTTLDEFVNTELSTAPLAEPSIGAGIVGGGRRSKSDREKREEADKKDYEERNYVRLPKESKKERAKKRGRQDAGYGGEEWRGLGEGVDRIDRLTKRRSGDNTSVLEKSRKRVTEDGPKGSGGAEVGQGFQKRLKTLDGGRRDRGRGRK